MTSEEKIMTLHPDGKQGVNILIRGYNVIRDFIVDTLKNDPVISFKDLTNLAEHKLAGSFDGSIIWYMVTVKLDLEARGIIERIPGSGSQKVRLIV